MNQNSTGDSTSQSYFQEGYDQYILALMLMGFYIRCGDRQTTLTGNSIGL